MAEIQVARAVWVGVGQVCTSPVEHRHEVVAYCMHALESEILQAFLVVFNQLVAVWTGVFDALAHGQAFNHRPAHAIAFDIFTQVADFLACPYFAVWHVVQGGDYTFHSDLFQHR